MQRLLHISRSLSYFPDRFTKQIAWLHNLVPIPFWIYFDKLRLLLEVFIFSCRCAFSLLKDDCDSKGVFRVHGES